MLALYTLHADNSFISYLNYCQQSGIRNLFSACWQGSLNYVSAISIIADFTNLLLLFHSYQSIWLLMTLQCIRNTLLVPDELILELIHMHVHSCFSKKKLLSLTNLKLVFQWLFHMSHTRVMHLMAHSLLIGLMFCTVSISVDSGSRFQLDCAHHLSECLVLLYTFPQWEHGSY